MFQARQFDVYCVNDNHKNMTARAKVVGECCLSSLRGRTGIDKEVW